MNTTKSITTKYTFILAILICKYILKCFFLSIFSKSMHFLLYFAFVGQRDHGLEMKHVSNYQWGKFLLSKWQFHLLKSLPLFKRNPPPYCPIFAFTKVTKQNINSYSYVAATIFKNTSLQQQKIAGLSNILFNNKEYTINMYILLDPFYSHFFSFFLLWILPVHCAQCLWCKWEDAQGIS